MLRCAHTPCLSSPVPELPEVECARRLLEDNCVGATIVVADPIEKGGGPRAGLFDDIIMGEVCCA
jgi:hypothetical protein